MTGPEAQGQDFTTAVTGETDATSGAGPVDTQLNSDSEEMHSLEARLRAFHSDEARATSAAAQELMAIDRELRSALDRTQDTSYWSRSQNSEVLSRIADWKDLCRGWQLDGVVAEADQLVRTHVERVADDWKQVAVSGLESPESAACFERMMQTTAIQLELQNQLHEDDPALAEFSAIRQSLRQMLLVAIDSKPPSPERRQRWVTQLLDVGDIVMTSIDDLSPDLAAEQIAVVAEDCRWHLDFVETQFGKCRRQLRRKLSHVRAEQQERGLQFDLELKFGRRSVAAVERLVLILIFLVIGLMFVEFTVELPARTLFWFNVVDAAACCVFLGEFFTKFSIVQGKWLWFRRHFFIDFIPSIPFGLLTSGLAQAMPADAVRFGRLGRFLRLPRLVRYVRILRPIIRIFRGFGLMARGLDRLARRYGNILNQNVILYPTRAELSGVKPAKSIQRAWLGRLSSELERCWQSALETAPESERPQIARSRLEVLQESLVAAQVSESDASIATSQAREIPAGTLIEHLGTVTAHDLETGLSEPLLAQLARIVRTYSRPPFRWFPIISGCVPQISEGMSDSEVASAAARRLAMVLKKYHDVWFWVADLYGTVSPSQFIDRVGTTLVNSSFRPAYRLALFGGFLLLTQAMLYLTAYAALKPLESFLGRFVGTPVLILGGICVFVLGFGWWLKSLAREATEFYERSVQAQYLSMMDTVRCRSLERDTRILFDRVVYPESRVTSTDSSIDRSQQLLLLQRRARGSLLGEIYSQHSLQLETAAKLYRDWLDGALLTESDTRVTSQLLGNPGVRQFLGLSQRYSKKEIKALQKLDLVRQKALLGGPYLWFNFVSRAIAHSVARLLINYNQNAIELHELERLRPDERERYNKWLAAGDTDLTDLEQSQSDLEETAEAKYVTTAFTAMHFLDTHAGRDAEIEATFGPQVLRRLQTDRSLLIRRIFGTYPMHNRPKEQRVVNLYSMYSSWLSGGRALFLPLFLFLLVLQNLGGLFAWIWRAVNEIRKPDLRKSSQDAAEAHFFSAVRKIERIRGPVVHASIRLRMRMDPEYLDVSLPGQMERPLSGAGYSADARFLKLDLTFAAEVEDERRRAAADMQRLDDLLQTGLLARAAVQMGLPQDAFETEEHLRAAAVAYRADICGIRRCLSGEDILQDAYHMAARLPPMEVHLWPQPFLKLKFRRYWKQHGFGDKVTRRLAWRATRWNFWGTADCLRLWSQQQDHRQRAEYMLGEVVLHPGRITEQLVCVRTIQSLAILDVLHYREHIYAVGNYVEMGDLPGELLEWDTIVSASA